MSEPSPSPAALFTRLVDIMRTLRSPDGCPWDRKQTTQSLRRFLLEEAYEALEALDRGDDRALAEELGDLLFEVVFLAQIGAEEGRFTIEDALRSVTDKLVRRHPHVFGDGPRARTAEEVPGVWERIKAAERASQGADGKPERKTILAGVPRALPSLLRATAIGSRASAVGFDWQQAPDVVAKIEEEVAELREVITDPAGVDPARAEEEMGDLLFSLANLSRKLGIEPESALRKANDKFTRRFEAMEAPPRRDRPLAARRGTGGDGRGVAGGQEQRDEVATKARRHTGLDKQVAGMSRCLRPSYDNHEGTTTRSGLYRTIRRIPSRRTGVLKFRSRPRRSLVSFR